MAVNVWRLETVKMPILPHVYSRHSEKLFKNAFKGIAIEIPGFLLVEMERLIVKCTRKHQDINSHENL